MHTAPDPHIATRHFPYISLILGGQKSGKSSQAETWAGQWLGLNAAHSALLVACGVAGDDEMQARIIRHRTERMQRVPGMRTLEEPLHLPQLLAQHSRANTLVVVDCISTWLSNHMLPPPPLTVYSPEQLAQAQAALLHSLRQAQAQQARIVLISHEIGLGVIPLGREVRQFVDTLGSLNQALAALCDRVVLMVAGLALECKNEGCVQPAKE